MAKQKVFLVDDDSDILVLNRDFLESEGYDVVTAASCAEALEKIKLHSFSCIVLDVMLPDGSAFDLAPKIKEYTDCPIIFLTAKDQQEDVINGFKVGADDYITKPYSLPELSLRINVHIKRNMKSEGFLVEYPPLRINIKTREVTLKEKSRCILQTASSISSASWLRHRTLSFLSQGSIPTFGATILRATTTS